MSNQNLSDNSLSKNIIKFLHPPQANRHDSKPNNSDKKATIDSSPTEKILRSIKRYEKYSRARYIWNFQKHYRLKYRAMENSFFDRLTVYPRCELEIVKANLEKNLELSKCFLTFGLLGAAIAHQSLGSNLKLTVLLLSLGAISCYILVTQIHRLNWLQIAIAQKNGI